MASVSHCKRTKKSSRIEKPTYSDTVAVALDKLKSDQQDMMTWSYSDSHVVEKHCVLIRQIQNVLTEVLARQHLEMNNLTTKYWSVSGSHLPRGLKKPLASLASLQKTLVEILQKQMVLLEMYVSMKFRPPFEKTLQLLMRGYAHVHCGAAIYGTDTLHLCPEHWIEFLLLNNIPVHSPKARDKGTFRNQLLTTEAASVSNLLKIKKIHLVEIDELLPKAKLDCCWKELVEKHENW